MERMIQDRTLFHKFHDNNTSNMNLCHVDVSRVGFTESKTCVRLVNRCHRLVHWALVLPVKCLKLFIFTTFILFTGLLYFLSNVQIYSFSQNQPGCCTFFRSNHQMCQTHSTFTPLLILWEMWPVLLFSRLVLLLGLEDVFHRSLDVFYDVLVQLKVKVSLL